MNEQEPQNLESQTADYPLFTVFTPTYNRAYTLPLVYHSLKAQTYRDFEWLIVDDGSTDSTRELVKQWQKEASFPIRYLYQENLGKSLALNSGVQAAEGEFFICFDSDDDCIPEALERFKYYWDLIPEPQRKNFSSVVGLAADRKGNLIGTKFPQNVTDSSYLEIEYKYKVKGDKWGFDRTQILRKYLFPALPGEYVGEGFVWYAIARDNYKTRFVNEVLLHKEYLPDGITCCSDIKRHAWGTTLLHASILNNDLNWFRYAPFSFIRSAIHYSRFSFHIGNPISKQFQELKTSLGKVLWLITIPVSYLIYIQEKVNEQ